MSDFESRARRAAQEVRKTVGQRSSQSPQDVERVKRPRQYASKAVTFAGVTLALIVGSLVYPSGDDTKVPYRLAGNLRPFEGCDAVTDYLIDQTLRMRVSEAQRRFGQVAGPLADGSNERLTSEPASGAESDRTSPATTVPYSTTNIQEAGVDEPDVVKTDGVRIVAVAGRSVFLLEVVDGKPLLRGHLKDVDADNVFLSGDRVLVLRSIGTHGTAAESALDRPDNFTDFPGEVTGSGPEESFASLFDISDLASPGLLSTFKTDGRIVDARLVGKNLRLVTSSSPRVQLPDMQFDEDGNLVADSEQKARGSLEHAAVDQWLPRFSVLSANGNTIESGLLVDCDQVARPETFSGRETLAITSLRLDDFGSKSSSGVLAGGQTVYATEKVMYVTSTDWNQQFRSGQSTGIHKFSTDAEGVTTYLGSGRVAGSLLNQYSMSEREGVLRVATTVTTAEGSRWEDAFGDTSVESTTEGVVTTLSQQDGRLEVRGHVGGLGKEDNESIKSVRYIDDRAYVVTFRQTDPLYVVDLSSPDNPRVAGELKIPGYSAYLHPVGKDRILGVGQSGGENLTVVDDESESGSLPEEQPELPPVIERPGIQFSLFDVSDPSAPKRLDVETLEEGRAGVEFDPKAFAYWQPRNLAIAPVSIYPGGVEAANGAQLIGISESALRNVGRISYQLAGDDASGYDVLTRAFVIGDDLYLLGIRGLQVNDLDSRAEVGEITFPRG